MKRKLSIITALIFLSGVSFAGTADTTIANLKAAFIGESTASAKYAAYAEQATKEGFVSIAILFKATSKAEAIHAANHKTVLEKMGQKVDPVKPNYTVQTTKLNLMYALKGESDEIASMYPGYIAMAKREDAKDAVKSFTWAFETEKKHQAFYRNAMLAQSAGTGSSLPKIYWVCPKCGNTFDIAKPTGECGLCGTSAEKYIKFDK